MCNISAGFFRDGVSEGFFKGIAEGKAERDVEIIRTMLRKKRTIQEISDLTDIPIEEVKKVQKSLTS